MLEHVYTVLEHVYAVLEHDYAVLEHVHAILEQGGVTNQDILLFRKLISRECFKARNITKQDMLLLATIRYFEFASHFQSKQFYVLVCKTLKFLS